MARSGKYTDRDGQFQDPVHAHLRCHQELLETRGLRLRVDCQAEHCGQEWGAAEEGHQDRGTRSLQSSLSGA